MHQSFSVRALKEADITSIIAAAGGRVAHADAKARSKTGADYLVGDAVVELKMLDEEALLKPTHQEKLADLFGKRTKDHPVVVIDRDALPQACRRDYDRIIERPIQGEVRKARKQLRQTRSEYPETTSSILLVVNNGYTSLDHDALKEVVAHRVKQDTSQIDGVVVAGCYHLSDGFDTYLLTPCEYIVINPSANFPLFELLQSRWYQFVEQLMTKVIRGEQSGARAIEPVSDLVFENSGKRFVKPAPLFGPSEFYIHGRPRENSTGIETCPPVGLVVPGLSYPQWQQIVTMMDDLAPCLVTYQNWQHHAEAAREAASGLQPLVPVPIEAKHFEDWCNTRALAPSLDTLNAYALHEFEEKMRKIIGNAKELGSVQPSVFVKVSTQEIGQDKANDLSSISFVRHTMSDTFFRTLLPTTQMFHQHALVLGAAYAFIESIDALIWERDKKYCWQ